MYTANAPQAEACRKFNRLVFAMICEHTYMYALLPAADEPDGKERNGLRRDFFVRMVYEYSKIREVQQADGTWQSVS